MGGAVQGTQQHYATATEPEKKSTRTEVDLPGAARLWASVD